MVRCHSFKVVSKCKSPTCKIRMVANVEEKDPTIISKTSRFKSINLASNHHRCSSLHKMFRLTVLPWHRFSHTKHRLNNIYQRSSQSGSSMLSLKKYGSGFRLMGEDKSHSTVVLRHRSKYHRERLLNILKILSPRSAGKETNGSSGRSSRCSS